MTTSPRHSARAVMLDDTNRILLCRLALPDIVVWVAPGGGVEPGETVHEALRRELLEEIGFPLDTDPPHVWRQEAAAPGHAAVHNDYFLVRTSTFEPRDTMSTDQLTAENITGFRW
jgi:8-oxo-dGTP pyrophosphatase MutT (NUDIX family)